MKEPTLGEKKKKNTKDETIIPVNTNWEQYWKKKKEVIKTFLSL